MPQSDVAIISANCPSNEGPNKVRSNERALSGYCRVFKPRCSPGTQSWTTHWYFADSSRA